MCHSKKKGRNAQIKTLETMWKNSNTEKQILQLLLEEYGEEYFNFFLCAKFEYFGGYWFAILSDDLLLNYVKQLNQFFFEFSNGLKLKVADPKTDIIKTAKTLRKVEVGANG
jgi:hypothetical protein